MSKAPETMQLRQLRANLAKNFAPHLDPIPSDPNEAATHALTALALTTTGGMPINEAGRYVVDGGNDYGLDGIYFSDIQNTLFLVQSKFFSNQEKIISEGEMLKFISGTERLLEGDLAGSNEKIAALIPELQDHLEDFGVRIVMLIASTSTIELQGKVKNDLDRFVAKQNQAEETFSYRYLDFSSLYQSARLFSAEGSVDVEIRMEGLSVVKTPYRSAYGQVAGQDVGAWVAAYGARLFDQNVRATLVKSKVNDEILGSIIDKPNDFWYFNNGITAIARELRVSPGGEKKVQAISMSIVNGAQTAGTIARAMNQGVDVSNVYVQMRVIDLSNTRPGLDEEITRANNTQNELNALDFVSLDPRQDILVNELAQRGFNYIVKRGQEANSDGREAIEIKDAAIALACSHSLGLTAQAKRYVTGLWSNISSAPYTEIFNESTTADDLVVRWRIWKVVEDRTRTSKATLDEKDGAIVVHAEKFICYIANNFYDRMEKKDMEAATGEAVEAVLRDYKGLGSTARTYPANDFKTVSFLENAETRIMSSGVEI